VAEFSAAIALWWMNTIPGSILQIILHKTAKVKKNTSYKILPSQPAKYNYFEAFHAVSTTVFCKMIIFP